MLRNAPNQRLQAPSRPGTASTSSTTRTFHQRFQRPRDRSSTHSPQIHNAKRLLRFSSLRDLSRASRKPLAEITANTPGHSLRPSNSLYGTLRDQCTPPPPSAIDLRAPLKPDPRRSKDSSIESSAHDLSGVSKDSSYPTTPSTGKHPRHEQLKESPPRPQSMATRPSAIAKKHLSIRKRFSLVRLSNKLSEIIDKPSAEPLRQPQTLKPRPSALNLQIPRRRSSLTVLHLDSSHFEVFDPKQPTLHNRASTLTEPQARQISAIADSLRLITSSSETLRLLPLDPKGAPTVTGAKTWDGTLSPPFNGFMSRTPSNSSRALSDKFIRQSVIGPQIRFPKTFPNGPVPVPAPALGITHFKCFSGHRRMLGSRNDICPVPCMACKAISERLNWKCDFCSLRVCGGCMAELQLRKRDLDELMSWVERSKEEEARVEMAAAEVTLDHQAEEKEDRVAKEKEDLALKKVETARKRETR